MRQFNPPPGWPDAPTARWRPPKHWRPAEAWPAAPEGWKFWVDEAGRPVRGPIGRYGGPSRIKVGAIVLVPFALIALVLVNPFGEDSTETEPSVTLTTVPTTAPTTDPATTAATPVGRSQKPTRQEERTPTATPDPTESPTSTPTSTPTSDPSRTPTPTVAPTPSPAATTVVYQSCAQVRAAGKAPLHRGDPGYSRELDRNGDGVACERGNS